MVDTKRGVLDRIKWDVEDNNTLVWKFPAENISSYAQLIVNESQEVVFIKGGKKVAIFGPGKHTLSSANIPGFSSLISKPFSGKTPFTAEVWFINKVAALGIKWGTSTPIQIQDPKYRVILPISGYGQLGIKINSSDQFLTALVGTSRVFEVDNFIKKIKSSIIKTAKDSISTLLTEGSVSIFDISSSLIQVSKTIKLQLQKELDTYGVEIIDFSVESISVPDNDPVLKKLKDSLSTKAEMDIVGYNYKDKRTFDTLEKASETSGSDIKGSFMQGGVGLGVGLGVGNWIGDQIKEVASNASLQNTANVCKKCNTKNPENAKFCLECGFSFIELNNQKTVECHECNNLSPYGSKFCINCSNKL